MCHRSGRSIDTMPFRGRGRTEPVSTVAYLDSLNFSNLPHTLLSALNSKRLGSRMLADSLLLNYFDPAIFFLFSLENRLWLSKQCMKSFYNILHNAA